MNFAFLWWRSIITLKAALVFLYCAVPTSINAQVQEVFSLEELKTAEPAIAAIVEAAHSLANTSDHVRLRPPFIAIGLIVPPEEAAESIERHPKLCISLLGHDAIFDRQAANREFYRVNTSVSNRASGSECIATHEPFFPDAEWIDANRPVSDRDIEEAVLAKLEDTDLGGINKIQVVTNSKGELLWLRIYVRPSWLEAMFLGNTPIDGEASVQWMVYNFPLKVAVSLL